MSRSVLCKGVDEAGITFFTNYDSAKGDELAATPYASATFPWYLLNRQVHIRGPVTKVDPQATESYWSKRPRGSQLGAWASHQSQPIASRAALVDQLAEVTARFADSEQVPVPPNWGGYLIAALRGGVLAGPGRPACTTGFASSTDGSNACNLSPVTMGTTGGPTRSQAFKLARYGAPGGGPTAPERGHCPRAGAPPR